jgi:N-methylhydantoinase B
MSQLAAGSEWDAITLEIMWGRLLSCASQASSAILRTAFSSVVTSSHDFRYVLTDENGDSLAQSYLGEVMFVTTFPDCVKAILAEIGKENMCPGDVFMTNDPWIAAGHLPDIHIATPVFHRGRLVALSGSVIHISDIGGRFGAHDATEVYEEGLCFPIVRLYSSGILNEDILRILRANVRAWELAQGDIMAQVAGNQLGADLLCAFLDEYDLVHLGDLSRVLQSRVEQAMRAKIALLPDGVYERETVIETGMRREELLIHSVITIEDDHMRVDYAGSSDQTFRTGVNCVMNCTRSLTLYPLQALLLPDIPANEGAAKPIDIVAPAGSIMNALRPAPVDIRAMVTHLLPDHVIGSLAHIVPEALIAASGIRWLLLADRSDSRSGRRMITSFFQAGGLGASARRDGPNAKFFPIKSYHTPVERFELETGLFVDRKGLRQDSGGAGRFRGGLGQSIAVSNASEEIVRFTFYRPQMVHPAAGYFGGHDGATGGASVDGMPITSDVLSLAPGQQAVLETPGGGGYGDPHERDRESVNEDLQQEYISLEHASSYYDYQPPSEPVAQYAAMDDVISVRKETP